MAEIKAQIRMVRLILDLLESHTGVDLDNYSDEETWGAERSFRRTRNKLNEEWEARRQVPLFEVVDENGQPSRRGKRFLRLTDRSLKTGTVDRMAVMPAFLQYLQTLKGTILADQYKPLYQSWYAGLSRKDKVQFDKSEKKFFCFSKGGKKYDDKGEVLDEVYDALIKEVILEVSYRSAKGEQTARIHPLTLVMFNQGLYLLHRYEGQLQGDKTWSLKIESILDAKSRRKEPFTYPANYDPAKRFDGSFGFITGSGDRTEVVLEFEAASWVGPYLKERRWTGDETFRALKGGKERMAFTVSDMKEVSSWILTLGGEVKVIKPAALRSQLIGTAREILARHGVN